MGFVGIREPADLAPNCPLYAQCLYRADESGLTKIMLKGEGSGEVQTAISKTPVRQLSDERFKLRRPSDEPPRQRFYRESSHT